MEKQDFKKVNKTLNKKRLSLVTGLIVLVIMIFTIVLLIEKTSNEQQVASTEKYLALEGTYAPNDEIKFKLKGKDNVGVTSSNLDSSKITVMLDGKVVNPNIKKVEKVTSSQTGEVEYILTLGEFSDVGILSFKIAKETLTDAANNKSNDITFTTQIKIEEEIVTPVDETDILRGIYISNYGITYQDMAVTSITYDNSEVGKYGWRILNIVNNGKGTYDVDIISTGFPAKVYYQASSIKKYAWGADAGTYATDYFAGTSATGNNIYGANGLLNHFEEIEFSQTTSPSANKGGYKEIAGYSSTDKIFRASSLPSGTITKVRNLVHTDLLGEGYIHNKTWDTSTDWKNIKSADAKGMFDLTKLSSSYNTETYCWLATPNDIDSTGLMNLRWGTSEGSNTDNRNGVRPVVHISGVKLSDPINGICSIIE